MNEVTGRLLVVDDNEMNRDMLSRRLGRRGHNVTTADGGQPALDLLEKEQFDLVLLDIMMPGIDGLEVLTRLRRTTSAVDLPVIMATAKDDSSDVVGALQAGANDYVTKPLDFPVVLARVQTQLSLKKTNEALAEAHGRMKRDLNAAARFQHSLLPERVPLSEKVEFAWRYKPCDELAGDAVNVFDLGDGAFLFYVLDVSGHGVPAALLSVTATHSLSTATGPASPLRNPATRELFTPAEAAAILNSLYPMESNDGHYFTLALGILDADARRLRMVTAGHPGPIVLRPGDEPRVIDVPNLPVGCMADVVYEDFEVELRPGDRLYLYSDGLLEAANSNEELFGPERLNAAVAAQRGSPLDGGLDAIIGEVVRFQEVEVFDDDVSILAVEIKG
jgi:sigma-B regulation protein RsbU (phosphoserine phosphatase)